MKIADRLEEEAIYGKALYADTVLYEIATELGLDHEHCNENDALLEALAKLAEVMIEKAVWDASTAMVEAQDARAADNQARDKELM